MMGSAMILQTSNGTVSPASRALRDRLARTIGDKHMSVLTKMGAVLATGILDAGGRNVAGRISSSPGSAVGMALFLQPRGVIGCYLSHRRFWQMVVDRKMDYAVILEDDVKLVDGFKEKVYDC